MKFWIIVIYLGAWSICDAGQLYKYKDANGNLVFSDKPPEINDAFETISYAKTKKSTSKITLFYKKNNSVADKQAISQANSQSETKLQTQAQTKTLSSEKTALEHSKAFTLWAKNTLYSPVQIGVVIPETKGLVKKVIPARESIAISGINKKLAHLDYQWALGDPNSTADDYLYHLPFTTPTGHKVTQGFNGQFSHTSDYSKYAVDIAMDLGSYLTAVRSGTVVWVKDDYHMSGTTRYFLDKANGVKVLHDDGTFAVYAHILMDTAMVKEGDKVYQGQRLARSGSSGFSTGPHLHFVIIKNVGLNNVSIPFKFIDKVGAGFTPKRGMILESTN